MKLLHIAPIGHHAEGVGTVLKDLVPMQINAGHDVRIITIYPNRIYPDLPIKSFNDIDSFKAYLDEWSPDFVLFHSMYAMPFVSFYKELIKRGILYGIQMHGGLSEENYRKNHFKKVIANLLYFNRFMRKAKTIVYLSESEYQRCIVKRINPNKTIIPNGTLMHDDVDLAITLPTEKIEIIFVGRISMQVKGLDKLTDAIDMLGSRNDVHFSIYGNEDDIHTSILKERIKGKESIVEYKGGLYGDKKDTVMRKANIFILTSPSEGMPMGVLEALSYGMPCIVTPGTNMRETIQRNNAGWCADYDSKSIASVISKAIGEYRKDQQSFRKAAHEASKEYSWDNIARQSIENLRGLND